LQHALTQRAAAAGADAGFFGSEQGVDLPDHPAQRQGPQLGRRRTAGSAAARSGGASGSCGSHHSHATTRPCGCGGSRGGALLPLVQQALDEDRQTLAAARQRSVALHMRLPHCQEGSDRHPGASTQRWNVTPERWSGEDTRSARTAACTGQPCGITAILRVRPALCGASTTAAASAGAALLRAQKQAGEVRLCPGGGARPRSRAALA
jgi:hypothetical protein